MPKYIIRTAKILYRYVEVTAPDKFRAALLAKCLVDDDEEITSINEANEEGLYKPD